RAGGLSHRVHGGRERLGIGRRRLTGTADLPHVLQGGSLDLLVRGRRGEVVEHPDVPAHPSSMPAGTGVLAWQASRPKEPLDPRSPPMPLTDLSLPELERYAPEREEPPDFEEF